MAQPLPSPYKRGADDGMLFAIYLIAMFFASVLSGKIAALSLLSILLFAGVPVVIYYFLRRAYRTDGGFTQLSALWMHGIMIFLCGSALAAVVQVVWLKWIDPTYIADQLRQFVEVYEELPGDTGKQMAEIGRALLDNHAVPSAIQVVMEMIWLSVFSGSILSLLMSLLVRARPVRKE